MYHPGGGLSFVLERGGEGIDVVQGNRAGMDEDGERGGTRTGWRGSVGRWGRFSGLHKVVRSNCLCLVSAEQLVAAAVPATGQRVATEAPRGPRGEQRRRIPHRVAGISAGRRSSATARAQPVFTRPDFTRPDFPRPSMERPDSTLTSSRSRRAWPGAGVRSTFQRNQQEKKLRARSARRQNATRRARCRRSGMATATRGE